MDEAFTWRTGDLLQENGFAGLLIKATTLVNSTSADYRKTFFAAHHVQRISNLSNFLRILFMGAEGVRAEAPAACIIYTNSVPKQRKKAILHFAPLVANQVAVRTKGTKRRAWTIAIYEGDIQEIDYQDAVEDEPYLWKTALWGTFLDRRALRRLRRLMPTTIGQVSEKHHWLVSDGLKIKSKNSKSKDIFASTLELEGKSILNMDAMNEEDVRFVLPHKVLERIEAGAQHIRGKQALGLIPAPHLVVNATIAVFSDQSFVIPDPQIGIAGTITDANYLKAVGLYLNTSVARYCFFFSAASWGVGTSKVSPDELRQIPLPTLTTEQINQLAFHYDTFAERERFHWEQHELMQLPSFEVQEEVDSIVESIIGVPDRVSMIAHEFMQVRYQLLKGKTRTSADARPSFEQLVAYAEQLRLQIDDFAQLHFHVSIVQGKGATIATVRRTQEQQTVPVTITMQENKVSSRDSKLCTRTAQSMGIRAT